MSSRLVDAPRDDVDVMRWRDQRFDELGFDDSAAARLLEARVDWHEAARLLDRGCDHGLVVEILT